MNAFARLNGDLIQTSTTALIDAQQNQRLDSVSKLASYAAQAPYPIGVDQAECLRLAATYEIASWRSVMCHHVPDWLASRFSGDTFERQSEWNKQCKTLRRAIRRHAAGSGFRAALIWPLPIFRSATTR